MGCLPLDHPATYENQEEAKRVFKRLKANVYDFDELDVEEIGLLALHYPHVLPCPECDAS